jgi:hypothetical protein
LEELAEKGKIKLSFVKMNVREKWI